MADFEPSGEKAVFHWIRKSFEAVNGLAPPESSFEK